jgi:hypothetical protein
MMVSTSYHSHKVGYTNWLYHKKSTATIITAGVAHGVDQGSQMFIVGHKK